MPKQESRSVAALIAQSLKTRGIQRVFGLCGGHIMPIWMECDALGIEIIGSRDERAAVYMAHAHSELTGEIGVALVTAGPGLANAMTGIANAHLARTAVLVLSGVPPRYQANRGALQELPQVELVQPITRYARTVREPTHVLPELDEAIARALGVGNEPGPAYLDFPTDTLRSKLTSATILDEHLSGRPIPSLLPDPTDIEKAADLISGATRLLVISGRGARGAEKELISFLDLTGAAYLDTGESKGLIPDSHPSVVTAVRGTAMTEADVVVTLGRRLNYQLAYGSPAIFGDARFVRISDQPSELRDNRRGAVEILGTPRIALEQLVAALLSKSLDQDRSWLIANRAKHEERAAALVRSLDTAPSDAEGRMHPNRLLSIVRKCLPDDAIVIADGGDFLSFARVAIPALTYLDPGVFGCLGIGTPFGISAGLAHPRRIVAVLTGDGAFGFSAMEIDTAVRHRAPVLIVIANNGSWAIEVRDQEESYGKEVGTRLQFSDYAAMARAFGMHGERVSSESELSVALDRALRVLANDQPALLDVIVSPIPASSDSKSGLATVPDLQAIEAWDQAELSWRLGTNDSEIRAPIV